MNKEELKEKYKNIIIINYFVIIIFVAVILILFSIFSFNPIPFFYLILIENTILIVGLYVYVILFFLLRKWDYERNNSGGEKSE